MTYISKFFRKEPQKGEQLINYINTQPSLASLVNVPFFCMALCNMKEGNFLKDATDTLTKLFKQLILYLVHHARARNESGDFSEVRVNSMVNAVGEVALKKLTDSNEQNLIFSRADFEQCSGDLESCLQVGLLSKEVFVYDPVNLSDEVHAAKIMFFHKLAQEYSAGVYLAGLEHGAMKNVLCKLDSVDKVLAVENVLHFAAGTSPDSLIPIAEHMNAVWDEKETRIASVFCSTT